MEPLRKETTEFWVSAALLAQLFAVGLNAARMLANFFLKVDQVGENPRLYGQLIPRGIDGNPGGRVDGDRYPVDDIGDCYRAHGCLSGGAGNNAGREQRTQIKCSHAPPHTDDLSTQKATKTQARVMESVTCTIEQYSPRKQVSGGADSAQRCGTKAGAPARTVHSHHLWWLLP